VSDRAANTWTKVSLHSEHDVRELTSKAAHNSVRTINSGTLARGVSAQIAAGALNGTIDGAVVAAAATANGSTTAADHVAAATAAAAATAVDAIAVAAGMDAIAAATPSTTARS